MKVRNSQKEIDDLMLQAIEAQHSRCSSNGGGSSSKNKKNSTKSRDDEYYDKKVHSNTESSSSSSSSPPCSSFFLENRCIVGSILLLLFGGGMFGILFATGVLKNDDLTGIPVLGDIDFEGFFDSDPYGGAVSPENPQDAYRWYAPDQAGLELTVLNALTDDWQTEFEIAMTDWDVGQPDTLTLTSRRVDVDVDCEPLDGLLKVCNGNYGETDWRGLNVVLLDMERKWIYSSTAKMNEFFLSQASSAQRQYTMCHEIGHGFGLPHWDEDFYNRNMGNCMDYTSRPRSNQQPSASNFEFLKQLYGEVGNSTTATTTAATTSTTVDSSVTTTATDPPFGWGNGNNNADNNNNNNENEDDEDNEDRRMLRQSAAASTTTTTTTTSSTNKKNHDHRRTSSSTTTIPEEVMAAYKAVTKNGGTLLSSTTTTTIAAGSTSTTIDQQQHSHHRRRVLVVESNEYAESSLIDMGYGGYGLLVYKLRPLSPSLPENDDDV